MKYNDLNENMYNKMTDSHNSCSDSDYRNNNGISILRVQGYSKHFKVHEQNKIIPSSHNVNFTVNSGQLTALIGATGSGKSTILKGIYRSYLPSSGKLLYRCNNNQEVDLATADEHHILELRRTEIAFVTQFLHVLPRQSTEDVVAQPLLKKNMDKTQARDLAREMLAALNLPEALWAISPATFSGGEKQRVNLARGLISQPRLLLLDEPTSSLDPKTTEQVVRLIEKLKGDGIAMLAIFHHPELVARLANHVVELESPSAIQNT
jgi:alpha-D-ribose 1-methylphosphonate 5-triphosphate synthase subunit PhnL